MAVHLVADGDEEIYLSSGLALRKPTFASGNACASLASVGSVARRPRTFVS
jgi:hypothetical protein